MNDTTATTAQAPALTAGQSNAQNEAAFVRDCMAFNEGRTTVNPYVGNWTCYGIPYDHMKPLLTAHGVFHSIYNPMPTTPQPLAGQPTAQRKLTSPYNLSHPDSRCNARKGRPHRFKTVFRGPLKDGIRLETSRCEHCGGEHDSTVDYGLLSAVFTVCNPTRKGAL